MDKKYGFIPVDQTRITKQSAFLSRGKLNKRQQNIKKSL